MKQALLFAFVLLVMAACGSDQVTDVAGAGTPEPNAATTTAVPFPTANPPPATSVPATPVPNPTQGPAPTVAPPPTAVSTPGPLPTLIPPTPTPTVAPADERGLLDSARQRWATHRPDSYELRYRLQCECDGGPWIIEVDGDTTVSAHHAFRPDELLDPPYVSVDSIFDEIEAGLDELEAALDTGGFPIRVEYDDEFGYPLTYFFNEPGLPSDAGFVVITEAFTPDTIANEAAARQAYRDALARWEQGGSDSYDMTYRLICFCGPIEKGPYEVAVRNGQIVAATFGDVDILDIEEFGLDSYDNTVSTIDEIFAEIGRGLDTASSVAAEYDQELGYPTNVFIDWDFLIADEEVGYEISNVRVAPASCSTATVRLTLTPQPGLPAAVAAKRQAIFDAAVACDIEGLVALTDPDGFKASFGDDDPSTLWQDAEERGDPVLLDLVRHLNQAFEPPPGATGSDLYVWPSAFNLLQDADGSGLPADDYALLLQLYSRDELQGMFDGIGGYIGYRTAITTSGDWVFFVAGD